MKVDIQLDDVELALLDAIAEREQTDRSGVVTAFMRDQLKAEKRLFSRDAIYRSEIQFRPDNTHQQTGKR